MSDPLPPDPLSELARSRLGVPYLYPVQRFVISNTLEGKPQIVVLPTGAGKSLCFQLPSLLLPGPTLVILPLLSLMSDQLRKLSAAGVESGALRGGLEPAERERLFAGVRAGAVKIVFTTPEACLPPRTLAALRSLRFSHLVIDEAHCVAEWGDSFRPAYREVGGIGRALGIRMRTAFTATASPAVIARIRELAFDAGEVRVVAGSADRPNISYAVVPILSLDHALAGLLRVCERPLLVFFRTRGGAELAARRLRGRLGESGLRFYHAGLSRGERAEVERWFLASTDGVLFATCAYGLGVDKADIRTIAHAQVPSTVEAYLQETGRAGRDGRPARAVLFVSREDRVFGASLKEGAARERYLRILGYALAANVCRRQTLLSLIGQEPAACSGCDICDGNAQERPAGRSEILRFVAVNRRRFSPEQSALVLSGTGGPRALRGFSDVVRGWGALQGWDAEDVEAALMALCADGELAIVKRGPWKGKVTLPRRARLPRVHREGHS